MTNERLGLQIGTYTYAFSSHESKSTALDKQLTHQLLLHSESSKFHMAEFYPHILTHKKLVTEWKSQ